jgi:hypothetical protein
MERKLENPWNPGDTVKASRCWACHKDFAQEDVVKVVDAYSPKLVHDREPCRDAMIQQVQG